MGANVKLVDFSPVLDHPNISRHVAKVRTAKTAQPMTLGITASHWSEFKIYAILGL